MAGFIDSLRCSRLLSDEWVHVLILGLKPVFHLHLNQGCTISLPSMTVTESRELGKVNRLRTILVQFALGFGLIWVGFSHSLLKPGVCVHQPQVSIRILQCGSSARGLVNPSACWSADGVHWSCKMPLGCWSVLT